QEQNRTHKDKARAISAGTRRQACRRVPASLTASTGRNSIPLNPFLLSIPLTHSPIPFSLIHANFPKEDSALLAVNEERYMREVLTRIVGSQPDPNPIALPLPAHDIVLPTPKRRRKGPCMSRRRGQTGYVWQKNQSGSKNWDPTIPAYGQVWVDVPGKEKRQRKFYQLGECRTKSEARRRLTEMIEKDGINSTVDIEQSIDSTAFSQQAELWIKAIEDGRVLHRAKRTRIKPATITGYKSAIEWMSPH